MQHLWLASGLVARAYDASSQVIRAQLEKRDEKTSPNASMVGLVIINLILMSPVILYMVHTLSFLLPTLAITEMYAPEYQQVPANADDEWTAGARNDSGRTNKLGDGDDEDDDLPEGNAAKVPPCPQEDQQQQQQQQHDQRPKQRPLETYSVEQPVAPRKCMSVRKLHRALYRTRGLRSMFHGLAAGLWYSLVVGTITVAATNVPVVGGPLGRLVGALLGVQFALRWNHRMLTAPGLVSSSSRQHGSAAAAAAAPAGGALSVWMLGLPPFAATFRATALPALALGAADALATYAPAWAAYAATGTWVLAPTGSVLPLVSRGGRLASIPPGTGGVFLGLHGLLSGLLQVPALVVLTRLQAALLADNDVRTVVPLDRTFGVPGGLFAAERDGSCPDRLTASWRSMVAAFRSFKGQWVDLYIFFLKTGVIIVALEAILAFTLVLEAFVFLSR